MWSAKNPGDFNVIMQMVEDNKELFKEVKCVKGKYERLKMNLFYFVVYLSMIIDLDNLLVKVILNWF